MPSRAVVAYKGYRLARRASRYARFTPQLRAAYMAGRAARFVLNNRRGIKRAAKYVSKYGKRRKRITGAMSTTPRVQYWLDGVGGGTRGNQTIGRKELFSDEILFARAPESASGNEKFGQARANKILVKGIKLCAMFRNIRQNTPIEIHWAIIQRKGPSENPDPLSIELFSDPSSPTAINRNFTDVSQSPAWTPENLCQGLNRKRYNIFTHQKFTLDPVGAEGQSRNHKTVHKYFPINKYFSYESTLSLRVEKPLYFLAWCETMQETNVASSCFEMNVNAVSYFKSMT